MEFARISVKMICLFVFCEENDGGMSPIVSIAGTNILVSYHI